MDANAKTSRRVTIGVPVDWEGKSISGPREPIAWRTYERLLLDGAPVPSNHYGKEGAWRRGKVLVRSSLIAAPFHDVWKWQWLVSVSRDGRRANDETVTQVLKDFGIPDAEEDNHKSGVSRAFFRICDLAPGTPSVCECKIDEKVIVEPDGYTYSEPKDPVEAAAQKEEFAQMVRHFDQATASFHPRRSR